MSDLPKPLQKKIAMGLWSVSLPCTAQYQKAPSSPGTATSQAELTEPCLRIA